MQTERDAELLPSRDLLSEVGFESWCQLQNKVYPDTFSKAWLAVACWKSTMSERRPSSQGASVRNHDIVKSYLDPTVTPQCVFFKPGVILMVSRMSLIDCGLSWHLNLTCTLLSHSFPIFAIMCLSFSLIKANQRVCLQRIISLKSQDLQKIINFARGN